MLLVFPHVYVFIFILEVTLAKATIEYITTKISYKVRFNISPTHFNIFL